MKSNRTSSFLRVYAHYLIILALLFAGCNESSDPKPFEEEDNLVEEISRGTQRAGDLKLILQLSGLSIDASALKYDVKIYKVIYTTTYKDQEIEASGLVFLPDTKDPLGMVSFQHGTIVENADAPTVQSSSSFDVLSYSALSSMGFITVVPDMIGFGESSEVFHPYYVEEPTADAVLDLVRAGRSLAEKNSLNFNEKLFLAGYSQGGYSTLAAHKAFEAEPLEGFNLVASFPAAGAYDIEAMQEHFFSLETYSHPYYLAYVGLSYQSYYDEPGLLSEFFNEPYASRIDNLFDGKTSKSAIVGQLTTNIKELVHPNILEQGSDPAYLSLKEKFAENSLVDWTPTIPVYFYHGDADTTVPYENSVITYEKLIANGTSESVVQLINLPGRTHDTGIEPYLEQVLAKLQSLK